MGEDLLVSHESTFAASTQATILYNEFEKSAFKGTEKWTLGISFFFGQIGKKNITWYYICN